MTVVAACQLRLAVGDTGGNLATAAAAVGSAAAAGAGLVVLPELCDSGYVFTDAAEARALASPAGESPALRHWQAYLRLDRTGPWADHARGQIRKLLSREKLAIAWRAQKYVAPASGKSALRVAESWENE